MPEVPRLKAALDQDSRRNACCIIVKTTGWELGYFNRRGLLDAYSRSLIEAVTALPSSTDLPTTHHLPSAFQQLDGPHKQYTQRTDNP